MVQTGRIAGALALIGLLGGAFVTLDAGGQGGTPKPAPSATPTPAPEPAAGTSAGFSFGEPKYTFELDDVRSGKAGLEIVSASVEDLDITAHVTVRTGPAGAPRPVDTLEVQVGELPPAGRVAAKITGGASLGPGTHRGRISAFAEGSTAVMTVPVVISDGVAAEPVGKKIAVRAIRWVPFKDETVEPRAALIPLKGKEKRLRDLTINRKTLLGGLSGSRAGLASVRPAGVVALDQHGLRALEIDVANFNGPGTYAGNVDLDPDDDGGDVEVTVVVTDFILWPALALMLGIGLAYRVRRWIGVGRPLSRLATREADLHKRVRKLAPVASAGDFETKAAALREKIQKLDRQTPGEDISKKAQKEAVEELRRLEQYVADLEGLEALQQSLEAALKPVRGLSRHDRLLDDNLNGSPAWVERAEELLTATIATVEQMTAHVAEMKASIRLAPWWVEAHNALAVDLEAVDALHKHLGEPPRGFGLLHAAWSMMWRAPTAAEAADEQKRKRLEHARLRIELDMWRLERFPAMSFQTFLARQEVSAASHSVQAIRAYIGELPGDLPDDPVEREKQLVRFTAGWDAVVTAVAFGVALFSGLTALYVGKTFGTLTDYLSALFWGLTTATAVDLIMQTLRRADLEDGDEAAKAA